MVYIVVLFDTVKPLVNSPGCFVSLKSSSTLCLLETSDYKGHVIPSVSVIGNQLLPPQLNPLSLLVSVFDTLFGFMPKCRSAASPDVLLTALTPKKGCRFGGCIYSFNTVVTDFRRGKTYRASASHWCHIDRSNTKTTHY